MVPSDIEEFGTEGERAFYPGSGIATAFGRDVAALGRSSDATSFFDLNEMIQYTRFRDKLHISTRN